MNKRFINKEFVLPITIAIIAVCIVAAILYTFLGNQYFYHNSVEFAKIGTADIKAAEAGANENIREVIKPNTAIGSIAVGDTKLPLVFSPDYANTRGNFCQIDNGILISETGNAVIYCNKNSGDEVRTLTNGDTVYISTFYGDYEYKVVSCESFSGEISEHSFANGIGRGLTICTAKNGKVGMTAEYVAVNCELVSGTPVAE